MYVDDPFYLSHLEVVSQSLRYEKSHGDAVGVWGKMSVLK